MRSIFENIARPSVFWLLAVGSGIYTFSYFGAQTILTLYLLNVFHFARSESYTIYGLYGALAYTLPTVGGIIADKFLGDKDCVFLGSYLTIIGNVLLINSNYYLFCLGLSASLLGLGLYKSNALNMIGNLYQQKNIRKEQAFTILYLIINIGGVLGPLIYGLAVYALGWHYGFLFSAIAISLWLIWLHWNHQQLHDNVIKKQTSTTNKTFIYLLVFALIFLLTLPFYYTAITNIFVIITFIICITYLIKLVLRYKDRQRLRLWSLLILSFFGMFYFAASLQIGTTITLFINQKIHENIIKTHFPASIFSALYPFFVLILAPFITYLWAFLHKKDIKLSVPTKFSIGITLASFGIAAFAQASLTNYVWPGIILGYLLLSAGEIVLTPTMYTAISDISPDGMKSTMMGCWLLFVGLGEYLSSILAKFSHVTSSNLAFDNFPFFGEFVFISGFTLLIAFLLTLCMPKLSKMMQ